MKAVQTYIVLADEHEVRVLENEGVGKGVRQVGHFTIKDCPDYPPDYADEPGVSHSSAGPGRAGVEHSTSLRDARRQVFARFAADKILSYQAAESFDRLILSAAPNMLGELRDELSGKIDIYAELDKNLVNTPLEKLPKHLEKVLAV